MSFIISQILVGLIGWMASVIMRTDAQQGARLNVVVGVVGSLLGAWFIAPMFGSSTTQSERLQRYWPDALFAWCSHTVGRRQPLPMRESVEFGSSLTRLPRPMRPGTSIVGAIRAVPP